MTSPTLVHDSGTAALAALMTRDQILAADRRARSEAAATMDAIRKASSAQAIRLTPQTAVPLLIDLRSQLEERARRDARCYSAHRWLWYLLRIPDLLVEGRVGTTLSYTLGIAEALTDRADGNSAPILRDDWISFKVDEHVTRHVLTLVCRTRFIFTAHRLIRTVGKGCDLRFDAEDIPHADCTDGLRQSMMLFDDRMARSQELLSRAGSPLPMTPAWEETDRALLACFRIEPQQVEAPFPVEGVSDPRIRAQFKPMFVSVEYLKEFNTGFGGQQWWQPEAVTLTMFLALSAHLLFELPNAAFSVMQFGYVSTSTDVLHAVWGAHWREAVALTEDIFGIPVTIHSAEALLSHLRLLKGAAWTLVPPSPIRGNGALAAVDLDTTAIPANASGPFIVGSVLQCVPVMEFEEIVSTGMFQMRVPYHARVLEGKTRNSSPSTTASSSRKRNGDDKAALAGSNANRSPVMCRG